MEEDLASADSNINFSSSIIIFPAIAYLSDDIPVEVWTCLHSDSRPIPQKTLTNLSNDTLAGEKMPSEWRMSVQFPIFKNKGGVQQFSSLITAELN